MRQTPWSRIREQNSVYKEFLEIVGHGKANGQCSKGDNKRAKTTQPNRLRILSCSRMSEMRREREVPEAEVPVVECFDGLARITLEELAITHFVKNGTLQNACSTSPMVVAELEKSALLRIARLTNRLAKGLKRMVTKVLWLCCRSMSKMIERGDPLYTTHQIHDNWVAYSRIWSRRSLHRF